MTRSKESFSNRSTESFIREQHKRLRQLLWLKSALQSHYISPAAVIIIHTVLLTVVEVIQPFNMTSAPPL